MKKVLVILGLVFLLVACSVQPVPRDGAESLEAAAGSWQQLGGALDINFDNTAKRPNQVLDGSGNPGIVWTESDYVYVKRWNGSRWIRVGGVVNNNIGKNAEWHPSVAIDQTGNPVVSWVGKDIGTSSKVYVKRWNGTAWVKLGSFLNINRGINTVYDVANTSVVIDQTGNPVVSWQECVQVRFECIRYNIYVKRWSGSQWVVLGNTYLNVDPNKYSNAPILASDAKGNPVISWGESDETSSNVYVKRWTGSNWVQLGTLNATETASAIYLGFNSQNNPVVGVKEFNGDIYIKRWTGNQWQQLGSLVNAIYGVSLVVDRFNKPIVVFQEQDPNNSTFNLYVRRWNGVRWVQLGTYLDVNIAYDAVAPVLKIDTLGNLVTTWEEYNSFNLMDSNIYVKKYILTQ
jgi:hypothetical protein